MKRTLVLLAILALLGGVYYFMSGNDDRKVDEIMKDRNFAVDQSEIKKVVITEKDGTVNTLIEDDGLWFINGNRISKNQKFLFLEALTKVRINSIPAKGAYDAIMKTIGKIGILVRVYDANDKMIRSYYVGGVPQGERGTYYLMDGARQPYLMELPGMEGSTRGRFVKRKDEWLDRAMFRYPAKDISKISVEYPRSKNDSYTIEKVASKYEVKPFYNFSPKITSAVNERVIDSYLANYHTGFFTEAYVNEHPLRDSIVTHMEAFCNITVQNDKGQINTLNLYPLNEIYDTQGIALGPDVDKYIERYYVNVNNGDRFMLTQQILAKKFLWSYKNFFR